MEDSSPQQAAAKPSKLKAPVNAADCHIHVYDTRFKSSSPALPDASVPDYRLVQKHIGTSRVVIVTPRPYATDNSVTVDAIRQLGLRNARGIAVLRPTVTDTELKTLNEAGIRGVRFTLGRPQSAIVSVDMIEPLAKRIAAFGWHVQLNAPADTVVEQQDMLRRLPTQIVFDHMGVLPLPTGLAHPTYGVIRSLVDKGRAWVKVSGPYLNSRSGPPNYADVVPIAYTFVKAAPERLVWGSDWPHSRPSIKPDTALLFDLLDEWVPLEATRNRILVANPEALYGFAHE